MGRYAAYPCNESEPLIDRHTFAPLRMRPMEHDVPGDGQHEARADIDKWSRCVSYKRAVPPN